MAARSGDGQAGLARQGGDQAVDALVRRQSPDEEDALTRSVGERSESSGIGAAVDDRRLCGREVEQRGGVVRHGEVMVEQERQDAEPVATT